MTNGNGNGRLRFSRSTYSVKEIHPKIEYSIEFIGREHYHKISVLCNRRPISRRLVADQNKSQNMEQVTAIWQNLYRKWVVITSCYRCEPAPADQQSYFIYYADIYNSRYYAPLKLHVYFTLIL